ncbi:site-specific DNA-methyltransferase [Marinilongibacter aquaticus]|uniref:site-specific DNA-methyltransferase n=1 Tax=Marinilongibacter aquaticus TaxID=2975157 RepID=UPI0021BDAFFF|nr:site-specific DNA-methyltransferase [Marinilongibacter aquaticus]UBM59473.1 site-specific DNA-methyltransferase [Marinilongibacter aquaticus]
MKKKDLLDKVINEDARNILEILPNDLTITTTITSPPYFDMKDYGSENQIGYGQSYENYLDDIQKVFNGVYNRTCEAGTLWVIIDTFKRNNQVVTLPFDLSDKLKQIGWLLQDIIIWKKDKTVPWSTNGFMQRKFEYILFFSKTPSYKSNKDSVRVYDTNHLKRWWVKYPERYNPRGKALDEIWEFPIPTQGSWGNKYIKHFCPLPESMVATMIQISSDEGDIVFDPFAGTGTVLSQSAYMKRRYIGLELNPSYVKMFETYLEKTIKDKSLEYDLYKQNNNQIKFEKNILDLRALKYARVLISKIEKESNISDFKILVTKRGDSNIENKLIKVEYNFIGTIDQKIVENILNEITIKPPLSKFGIDPVFKFSNQLELETNKFFGYTKTNTHSYEKNKEIDTKHIRVISEICIDLNENDYL